MLDDTLDGQAAQRLTAEVLLQSLQGEGVLVEALAKHGIDLDEGVLSGSDVEGLDHQPGSQLGGIALE